VRGTDSDGIFLLIYKWKMTLNLLIGMTTMKERRRKNPKRRDCHCLD